jgi:hypothetical protein
MTGRSTSADGGTTRSRQRAVLAAALSLLAYGVVFGLLARPWLLEAATAQPRCSPFLSLQSDARLIVFVLDWVARTWWTAPSRLFDLPIHFPAPEQLAGTEHFLSAQLLFGPLRALSHHPVIAANWTLFLSYPLGAFAMERLARWLGAGVWAAWLAGLVFALGPLRIPANLQTLQYPNVFIPLTYGCVVLFRARPSRMSLLLAVMVLTVGFFSSYYMATMLALVVPIALVVEIGPRRWREAIPLVGATVVAVALLTVWSLPYFGRPDVGIAGSHAAVAADLMKVGSGFAWASIPYGGLEIVLSAVGCLAFLGANDGLRRLAATGVVCSVVGILLALGPSQDVGGMRVTLPFTVLAIGPMAFLRVPVRFMVVAGFGTAALTACAFEMLARRLSAAFAALAFVAVAAIIIVVRGTALSGDERLPLMNPSTPATFDAIGRIMRESGDGPLLELPAEDRLGFHDSDAMMHALWHRAPLVTGYTGYTPPHRALLRRSIERLPEGVALDDIAAATHVRWIVLKPPEAWPSPQARATMLERLESAGSVSRVRQIEDWTLLAITREPPASSWFDVVKAGPSGWRSALDAQTATTSTVVGDDSIAARLALVGTVPVVTAGSRVRVVFAVENVGNVTWSAPVVGSDRVFGVRATWGPAAGVTAIARAEYVALADDVVPGAALPVFAALTAPTEPGRYTVDVAVIESRPGATSGRANRDPLRLAIAVEPPLAR